MDTTPKLTPAELALGISRLLATVQAQSARIAALEAVAKAGDGLAEAVNDVVNDRHLTDAEFDEFMADTAAKLTTYRAAKEAANG